MYVDVVDGHLTDERKQIVRDYDLKLADPTKPWKWGAYFIMCPHDWPVIVNKAKET